MVSRLGFAHEDHNIAVCSKQLSFELRRRYLPYIAALFRHVTQSDIHWMWHMMWHSDSEWFKLPA